ncbi:hypothetical protein GCK72_019558 [Caenorhabditis remanei]|uniref:G-protein coupled receptors family 1 profile domain-containing protein n=1 Tax=Caenorhabditis remanei TaxID=31234 RepID=A0A6A5GEA2_CAERE|nr:hypothetical protein GCK72_019558 [Caenorhabditis remanei]KAF1753003.1 hypothetical protein GCK72_019558 [Caenorhabditis remanei]
MRLDLFLTSVHNAFRRCSAWLGMLMAVVRYLVITDITSKNNKFSSPRYGVKVILTAFFISFLFTLLFYLHIDIVQIDTWHTPLDCQKQEEDESFPIYSQQFNEFFESNNAFLSRSRLILEGIFAKLIPCFTLPILTGLLIHGMRKSLTISSSTVEISFANKNVRKSRKDRTTFLTIFVAASFFISEFPLGIVDMYKGIWRGDMNYETFSQNVVLLCDALFTINASIHCLIFFAMSYQYRRTVKNLINCLNCFKIKKQARVNTILSSF